MKKLVFSLSIIMLPIVLAEVFLGYALWVAQSNLHSSIYYLFRTKIYPRYFSSGSTTTTSFSPKSMYVADPYLGFSDVPGNYQVTITDRISRRLHTFKVTIDKDGNRITSHYGDCFNGKEEIWIFGDSCAYGWANDDETSFPFFLQQMLPDHRVINYAHPGYGTVHGYLQLAREKALQRSPFPEWILIAYADYFKVRNVAAPSRLRDFTVGEGMFGRYDLSAFTHPSARVDNVGRLQIDYVPLFCRFSDLCSQDDPDKATLVGITQNLLREIRKIGKSMGSKMILALIRGGPEKEVLSYASDLGYIVADIRPSEQKHEWDDFLPFDGHPGPLAQKKYADKVVKIIQDEEARSGTNH